MRPLYILVYTVAVLLAILRRYTPVLAASYQK